MSNSVFGIGVMAAVDEDVKTNRWTLGSVAAAARMFSTPARVSGMT